MPEIGMDSLEVNIVFAQPEYILDSVYLNIPKIKEYNISSYVPAEIRALQESTID